MTTSTTDARTLMDDLFRIMSSGDLEDFRRITHPEAANGEALAEPPASRVPGPDGWHATALWLRGMFSDLRWELHELVADGDLIVVYATMFGRNTGTYTRYDEDGQITVERPATGRSFATRQSHWFRVVDGLLADHWANRDDLGMATQLGFLGPPPS